MHVHILGFRSCEIDVPYIFSASLPLSVYTEDFVTSVVFGKDIVARLGLITMETFKGDIINVLQHACLPKVNVH